MGQRHPGGSAQPRSQGRRLRLALFVVLSVAGAGALWMIGTIAAAPTAPPVNRGSRRSRAHRRSGVALTTTTGVWSNEPATFTYAWRRCNTSGNSCSTIGGALASTYVPVAADLGRRLRSRVTARNALGSATATSNPTATVAAAPSTPQSTALPVTTGTPQVGATLTSTTGSWTNSPTAYAYTWSRCDPAGGACSPLPAATASSYAIVQGDLGATLRVTVTASNAAGSTSATAAPTALVTAAAPAARQQPCRPRSRASPRSGRRSRRARARGRARRPSTPTGGAAATPAGPRAPTSSARPPPATS